MSNQAYHNKGFGVAFLWIMLLFIVLPAIMILSIDDGFYKFAQMRGVTGDCWQNSQHERVCREENTCKFWRNFCIEEVYRWRAK